MCLSMRRFIFEIPKIVQPDPSNDEAVLRRENDYIHDNFLFVVFVPGLDFKWPAQSEETQHN